MELLQLKYFCDAAVTNNFSKTAKKFFVPPSDISQSIKRLEQELGVTLFLRSANRIQVSPQGQQFYQNVRRTLDLLDQAVVDIKNPVQTDVIHIFIHSNRRIVLESIEKFRASHPNTSFVTTHQSMADISDYDIIVTDNGLITDYRKTAVLSEGFSLVYNPDFFQFDTKNYIQPLCTCPFIIMNPDSSMYRATNEIFENLGITPNIVLQSEDPLYVRKCVEMGIGITFAPQLSWKGQFSEQIAFQTISGFTRTTYMYQRPIATPSAKAFAEILEKEFKAQY